MIRERIEELSAKHGGVRAAARVLEISPGYLKRLRDGEKLNPSTKILRKLKLRRVVEVRYEAMSANEKGLAEGYVRVPRDKLMKLLSSVAGDCYVGKIKEEELVEELRAMLQASPDTDLSVSGEVIGGWRPIETAPRKVEFRCLLGHEHSVVTGYWDGTMWVNERSLLRSEFNPTHWMPLPAAPDAPNDEGKP